MHFYERQKVIEQMITITNTNKMIFESTIATLDLNANRGLKVYTPLVRTEENLKSVIILEKSNTLIHFLKLLMI